MTDTDIAVDREKYRYDLKAAGECNVYEQQLEVVNERVAELERENRRLWLAVGMFRSAAVHGIIAWGEDFDDVESFVAADKVLGEIVPLTEAAT